MTDIAMLGLGVETKGLKDGSAAMAKVSASSAQTQAAVEKLSGSLSEAAKAAGVYVDRAGKLREANGRFVSSARQAELGMKGFSGSAEAASRSVGQVSGASSALNKVLALTAGYLSARAIIQASDQYGQMAARIKMATSSTEEYVKVQARLLDTANNTYRALGEAQELYIRTADAIRSLGFNTDEVLDITDSFSYLLVTNAASADRAASAIDAYSKAIATGKVDSDTWQSILAATPTIVNDIAAATGRSTDEVRKFGIQGKLSLTALNEALLQSRDRNEELAAAMETSVADATTALSNSFQVFIGKVNETSGASSILTDNIGELAAILQDPATIQAAQELAAGVVAALNTIISTAKEVVNFTRWMGEEIAVTVGGIGAGDIQRLEAESDRLQNLLTKMQENGDTGYAAFSNTEQSLNKVNAQIETYYKFLASPPPVAQPSADPTAAPSAPGAPKTPVELVAGTDEATEATKRLASAQREGDKAAKDLASAQQSNADVLSGLAEQIYQASLSAEELAKRQATLQLNQYATPEQIAAVQQLAGELERLSAREKAGADFEQVSTELGASGSGNEDIDALMIRYEERQAVIAQALATEYINQQAHDEAMLLLEQQTADSRKQIMADYTAAQQSQQLQSMAAIVSITQTQIGQMQGLFEEGTSIGKAFFVATQALAAANAVVQGFQSAMAIRVAYATMAAMSGPAAPALLAAGEAHANVAMGMGFATAGMIAGQTVASFDGGGYTGDGMRAGGLDGKGGFMAMLHPRESVVDHSKGQGMGGDSFTIAPTIMVNGNPDKSTIAMIEKATADGARLAYQQISNDLAAGRGTVTKSMQSGFAVQRRKS